MESQRSAVHIRPAAQTDSAMLARVQVDSWQDAFVGLLSEEYLSSVTYEQQKQTWQDVLESGDQNSLILVAETAERIVGYAWTNLEPVNEYAAEVLSLHILPHYKRQEIGRRLMRATARELLKRGKNNLRLWVLEQNLSARKFYGKLGGRLAGEHLIDLGHTSAREVSYFWQDIESLL